MSKNPKSIVVSFRLKPLVIAKAIDGLKNYDKSADISKLSSIIKQVTLHGINYLTNALPWEPTTESQLEVYNLTNQGQRKDNELSILGQPLIKARHSEPNYLTKESKSESIKKVVSDFSVPKELLEKEDSE